MSEKKLTAQDVNPGVAAVEFGVAVLQEIVKKHDAAQEKLNARASELKPEALEAFRDETRREFGNKAAAAFEKHIARFQHIPAEQRPHYSLDALTADARFAKDANTDALVSLSMQGRLSRASDSGLGEWAARAAKQNNFALRALVKEEVAHRRDALPNDIRAAIDEQLDSMKFGGREVELLDELQSFILEAEQAVSLVKTEARRYTMEQLSAMDHDTYTRVRQAQAKAGIRQ